jgi:hypothetical protein
LEITLTFIKAGILKSKEKRKSGRGCTRFFVFQAVVRNLFKLLILTEKDSYIWLFGLFGKRMDWSVVNDYFRIGIKIAFFSLFFTLSQQTLLHIY